jgi:hypothetical protein
MIRHTKSNLLVTYLPSVVLPVMAYLLLPRFYESELEPDQSAILFALKQNLIEEAYQEQLDLTKSRFKQKLERLKRVA